MISKNLCKCFCILQTEGTEQSDNYETVNQRGYEKLISLYMEERYDDNDEWCINAQN